MDGLQIREIVIDHLILWNILLFCSSLSSPSNSAHLLLVTSVDRVRTICSNVHVWVPRWWHTIPIPTIPIVRVASIVDTTTPLISKITSQLNKRELQNLNLMDDIREDCLICVLCYINVNTCLLAGLRPQDSRTVCLPIVSPFSFCNASSAWFLPNTQVLKS